MKNKDRRCTVNRLVSFLCLFVFLFSPVFQNNAGQISTVAASGLASEVVNHNVPYVHQLWDTADTFNGNWACGATSTVMALAYYNRLASHPITVSKPTSHTNNYGYYVSSIYNAYNYTFSRAQNDPSGHAAYGGYGHTIEGGSAWAWRIQDYLKKHGQVDSEFVDTGYVTLDKIKQALNAGNLVILSTQLTSGGHIILVRGYTSDDRLIVNDPFGNAFGSQGYGKYDGGNIQYTWSQVRAKWMVVAKGGGTGGSVDQDDNRTLSNNQSLDASISPNNDTDTYTFSGSQGNVAVINMQKTSGSLDSYLQLFSPDGTRLSYNDDANGTYDSSVRATLPSTGTYRILAHSYGNSSGGNYRITLRIESSGSSGDGDDSRWVTLGGSLRGTISPTDDRDTYYVNGSTDTVITIRMTKDSSTSLDSYLDLYDPSGSLLESDDDDGGGRDSYISRKLTSGGTYRIVTRSWHALSTGAYTLQVSGESRGSGDNLARGKSVTTFSQENSSFLGSYITDGNTNTRWSSGSSRDQFLWVDMGTSRSFSQVVIRWETARATTYTLKYWTGYEWRNIVTVNQTSGLNDTVNFSTVNARWVALAMTSRDARWGNYSLFEFEVYNGATALAPLPPFDTDPDKPLDDGAEGFVPLAPDPTEKELPVLTVDGGQETEVETTFDDNAAPLLANVTDTFGAPSAQISLSRRLINIGETLRASATNAHDNDSSQTTGGISAYRWAYASKTPGEYGAIAFTLGGASAITTPSDLAPGSYWLMLEVQDDEGTWSAIVKAAFDVVDTKIYVPLVMHPQ